MGSSRTSALHMLSFLVCRCAVGCLSMWSNSTQCEEVPKIIQHDLLSWADQSANRTVVKIGDSFGPRLLLLTLL